MTTAAESPQQTPADATRPTSGAAPGGLSLLPGLDAGDAGLCIDGVCRLPGAKD
ncbi:hypothetical protein [Microbacterium sp. 2MCAF23]|uniref:hypothetical protein n=1 Tax=Microbacterium sp. 2MCAF23 TaxID=3232985 RepID=UPI003F947D4B